MGKQQKISSEYMRQLEAKVSMMEIDSVRIVALEQRLDALEKMLKGEYDAICSVLENSTREAKASIEQLEQECAVRACRDRELAASIVVSR